MTTLVAKNPGSSAEPRRPSAGRALVAAGALALAALPGCSVWQQARRTILHEPSEFSWKQDRHRSLKIYRQWAEQAWIAENGSCPEQGTYDDYALGFRDGFVDYVYAGGEGEPPPVPPRKFWNVAWRTPAGDEASRQWFDGYRHGAQVARTGGYRERGIVATTVTTGAAPYWSDDESVMPPTRGEDVGAPGELLPMPLKSESQDNSSEHRRDREVPDPPSPLVDMEPIPTEAAPADPVLPALEEAMPVAPESVAPEAAAPDPAAPAPAANESATRPTTSARERFRRAAVAIHITDPSSAQ